MRLTIEPWAPEYGAPMEADALSQSDAHVDPDVELPAASWRPLDPDAATQPAACVQFVDGVRRIDARVWITSDSGTARIGICASYAAGLTRCERTAEIQHVEVRRGLFGPADTPALETRVGCYAPMAVAGDDLEQLSLGIQQRMGELETLVANESGRGRAGDALIVLDGPLTGRQNIPGAIGYVKTHRVAYLPPPISDVVARLNAGQRTPVFVTQTSWSRYSWYLRLPGPAGHPWAGVVRCEASADQRLERVRMVADQCARTLPRFASAAHKDPRAPQNLYPIAGLERELRRRLGDPAWIYRALRTAVT